MSKCIYAGKGEVKTYSGFGIHREGFMIFTFLKVVYLS